MNFYIVKYSEMILKGKNRNYFEAALIRNAKDRLKRNSIEYKQIRKSYSRLIIEGNKCECLKNVFGISYICNAVKTDRDLNEIEKNVLKAANHLNHNKSFKINSIRGNKEFSFSSLELNRYLGSAVVKKTKAKVDLTNPNLEIFVEILDDAYVYTERIKGRGGLPVGVEGKVIALIEDSKSILASLLMMKRGCSIIPVCYSKKDITLLEKYSYGKLDLIKIKTVKEVDKIAKQKNAKALVVNQTLNNLKELPIKTPVLRPLISFRRIKEKLAEF